MFIVNIAWLIGVTLQRKVRQIEQYLLEKPLTLGILN